MSNVCSQLIACLAVSAVLLLSGQMAQDSHQTRCPCAAGQLQSLSLVDESGRVWLSLSPTAVSGGRGLAILGEDSEPAIELGLIPTVLESSVGPTVPLKHDETRTVTPALRIQSPGENALATLGVQDDYASLGLCSGGDRIGASITVSKEKSIVTLRRALEEANDATKRLTVARARWMFGFDGSSLSFMDADGEETKVDMEHLLSR